MDGRHGPEREMSVGDAVSRGADRLPPVLATPSRGADAPAFVRYGLYPAFAALCAVPPYFALRRGWDLDLAFLVTSVLVYLGVAATEMLWPLRDAWRMD